MSSDSGSVLVVHVCVKFVIIDLMCNMYYDI
jgi:hypothetical protein